MSTTQNFYQLNVDLTESELLTSTEKIFVSIIQSYQRNGKKLYASNAKLAKSLGIGIEGLKTMIKRMNKKYNFFSSTRLSEKATSDNWTSTHEISIDDEKLKAFLAGEITSIQREIAPAQASIKEQLPIAPALEPMTESLPKTNTLSIDKETTSFIEPLTEKIFDLEQYLADKKINPDKLIKYKSDLEFLLPIIGGEYGMMLSTIYDNISRSNETSITLREAIPYINDEFKPFFKYKSHLLVSLPTKLVPIQTVEEPIDKSVSRPLIKRQRFPIEWFNVKKPLEFEGELDGSKVNVEIPMEGKQLQFESAPVIEKFFDIRTYLNDAQKDCEIKKVITIQNVFVFLKIEVDKDFFQCLTEANILPCKFGDESFTSFVNDYFKNNPTHIKILQH